MPPDTFYKFGNGCFTGQAIVNARREQTIMKNTHAHMGTRLRELRVTRGLQQGEAEEEAGKEGGERSQGFGPALVEEGQVIRSRRSSAQPAA